MTAYLLIVLTWLVFGGIHSVMATSRTKHRLQSASPSLQRYYRLLYNGLALLTFLPVLYALHVAPADFPGAWHGSAWAGSLVMGVGFLLGLFALRSYNLAEFIGWPTNQATQTGHLRQQGLLRYVRHPLSRLPYWSSLVSLFNTPTGDIFSSAFRLFYTSASVFILKKRNW